MLHVLAAELDPNDCCRVSWESACTAGELGASFTCPECGELWEPRMVGTVQVWEMRPFVRMLR